MREKEKHGLGGGRGEEGNGVDDDKSDAEEFLKDKDVHDLGGVLKRVQK